MSFAAPLWIAVTVAVAVLMVWRYVRSFSTVTLRYTRSGFLKRELGYIDIVSQLLGHVPFMTVVACFILLGISLARPQRATGEKQRLEGIDIMLVLDTSASMNAQDFYMNDDAATRLDVVKRVAADFVAKRSDDRIGVVIFGTEAFTKIPLTLDHDLVQFDLSKIESSVAGDATAIGDGLATALKRLEAAKKAGSTKSPVVILVTDGANNAGLVDPLSAGQAAKALGVKVYTIGVGRPGRAKAVIRGRVHVIDADIDEKLLQTIASETGGKFFRAKDPESLLNIYAEIDQLEKAPHEKKSYEKKDELFANFLQPAFLLGLLFIGMSGTKFRKLPF